MDLFKKGTLFGGLLRTVIAQLHNRNYLQYSRRSISAGYSTHHIRFLSNESMNNCIQKGRHLTVGQCVHLLTLSFQAKGITEPRSSAEYIIAHALGQKTVRSVAHYGQVQVIKSQKSHKKC